MEIPGPIPNNQLPETKEQWEKLKHKFLSLPDVEDSPETWTFVLSHLQGIKMPLIYFDMQDVWLHYKRWKIAKVLQDEKVVYIQALQAKLDEKMKEMIKELGSEGTPSSGEQVSSGSSNSEGVVPTLPVSQENLVQPTSEPRI